MLAIVRERGLRLAIVNAALQIATTTVEHTGAWAHRRAAPGAGGAAASAVAVASTTATAGTSAGSGGPVTPVLDAMSAAVLPLRFRDGILGRCAYSREQMLLERLCALGLLAQVLVLQVSGAARTCAGTVHVAVDDCGAC